jgi:hypothetical protein
MDAVTYPTAQAESALEEFVPLKLETTAWHPDYAKLLQRVPLTWTPMFIVTDHGGREVRRWYGFTPPAAFIAELELAKATIDRIHARPADAGERLERLAERRIAASAEALSWLGVARFNETADKHSLLEPWSELMSRYPDSVWSVRADYLELVHDDGGGGG